MENTIVVAQDPLFLRHLPPGVDGDGPEPGHGGHPERPARLAAAEAGLAAARLDAPIARLAPRDATAEELAAVHTEQYLTSLARIAGRRGQLDPDTYYSPDSYAAALRAAGAAVAVTEALQDGRATLGLALVRPPGHHARPGTAMGFCLLNNVAVAAAHARRRGARRVAIVDWDVHHGNGTQEMFYADPSVLYVSVHQYPFYPGTGAVDEAGAGEGVGATVNVPLPAGAGDAEYAAAFERVVSPRVAAFEPDLLLVSAGFDAHERDPLAGMRVTSGGYATLMRSLLAALPDQGRGRVGLILEGGYDLTGLSGALQATLEAAAGSAGRPGATANAPVASPTHEAAIVRALAEARRHGPLA